MLFYLVVAVAVAGGSVSEAVVVVVGFVVGIGDVVVAGFVVVVVGDVVVAGFVVVGVGDAVAVAEISETIGFAVVVDTEAEKILFDPVEFDHEATGFGGFVAQQVALLSRLVLEILDGLGNLVVTEFVAVCDAAFVAAQEVSL